MRKALAFALALVAVPAVAETPLTAEEFDAYTTGRTLTYSLGGLAFGIEEYRPNRRVRWSFLDGDCDEGEWYPVGEMICFAYDSYPEPQCWTFYRRNGGLVALFQNDPDATELYETRNSPEPLQCLGPRVGS